jgi:tripeptide aminopeptidase
VTVVIEKKRLLETFFELVRTDSETGDEERIARLLKKKFAVLGLSVREDNARLRTGHGANNLVADLPGNTSGTAMFFGTHMDTVIPGKKIKPRVQDGVVVSSGATILGSDDKAGIAALLEAIQVIQERHLPHADLQAVVTVGEEAGLIGARTLNTDLIVAGCGFELDTGGPVGTIIVTAPFQTQLTADLFGKAARVGSPREKGISAINMAAKAIARMPLGRVDEETTANIGRFEGGNATNIVGDYVRIVAEARSLSRSKLNQQINAMRQAFKETAREMGGKAKVHVELMYPGYRFAPEDRMVRLASRAAAAIGRTPQLIGKGGGSDANIFNGKGIPTLTLGVGYDKIHTTDEQIPVAELIKTAEMVLALTRLAVH